MFPALSGIRVSNGVTSYVYASKWETIVFSLVIPLMGGQFFWNTRVKRVDRKIKAYPKVDSYRMERVYHVFSTWFCAVSGLIMNIAVLFLNL